MQGIKVIYKIMDRMRKNNKDLEDKIIEGI
jgi:hypothetical protein